MEILQLSAFYSLPSRKILETRIFLRFSCWLSTVAVQSPMAPTWADRELHSGYIAKAKSVSNSKLIVQNWLPRSLDQATASKIGHLRNPSPSWRQAGTNVDLASHAKLPFHHAHCYYSLACQKRTQTADRQSYLLRCFYAALSTAASPTKPSLPTVAWHSRAFSIDHRATYVKSVAVQCVRAAMVDGDAAVLTSETTWANFDPQNIFLFVELLILQSCSEQSVLSCSAGSNLAWKSQGKSCLQSQTESSLRISKRSNCALLRKKHDELCPINVGSEGLCWRHYVPQHRSRRKYNIREWKETNQLNDKFWWNHQR